MAEAELACALVATDLNPAGAQIDTGDIHFAILSQFESKAQRVAISRFRSDFIVQFGTVSERDLVASSEVMRGIGFDMLVLPWSNRSGATVVDRHTQVAIDISGFPPHAFRPATLGPLLSQHCSIQGYRFFKRQGMCRVFGYAHTTRSIPSTGHITFQYQLNNGVRNIAFPVTIQTYPYSTAPSLEDEPAPDPSIDSVRSYDTGEKRSN